MHSKNDTNTTALKSETEIGLKKASSIFETSQMSETPESSSQDMSDHSCSKVTEDMKFATLLRNSKFIQIGDPNGRMAVGEIIEVLNDDLYIDFGGKFHTVCKRPPTRTRYVKQTNTIFRNIII